MGQTSAALGQAAARVRGLGAPRTCRGPPGEAYSELGRKLGSSTALREEAGGCEEGHGEPRGGPGPPRVGAGFLHGGLRNAPVLLLGLSGLLSRTTWDRQPGTLRVCRCLCPSRINVGDKLVYTAPLRGGSLHCGSPAQNSIITAVITTIYFYRAPHARVSRVVF